MKKKRIWIDIKSYDSSTKVLEYKVVHSGGNFEGIMVVPNEVYEKRNTDKMKKKHDELDMYVFNKLVAVLPTEQDL